MRGDESGDANDVPVRARLVEQIDAAVQHDLARRSPLWSDVFGASANPWPFIVNEEAVDEFRELYAALREGILALVAADAAGDPVVRERLALDERSRALVDRRHAVGDEYVIGSFRPDYVIDLDGRPLICEINARFTLNAYCCTTIGLDALEATGQLESTRGRACAETADCIDMLFSRFDLSVPLHVIKGREHGYSVRLLPALLPHTTVVYVTPSELVADDADGTGVVALRDAEGRLIKQALLELHQDELLGLPEPVLAALVDARRHDLVYANDLRTILLVHDKRFLSLLSDAHTMTPLVGAAAAARLAASIVPTIALSQSSLEGTQVAAALDDRASYLVKPALLGKGEGIRFGKDFADSDAWAEHVRASVGDTLQQYVRQREMPIFARKETGAPFATRRHLVVGTLLCTHDAFLGMGIFRSSADSDLVAISRNGTMMLPAIAAPGEGVPACGCQRRPLNASPSHSVLPDASPLHTYGAAGHAPFALPEGAYLCAERVTPPVVELCGTRLLEHGIAIVRLECAASDRTRFLTDLVGRLGTASAHDAAERIVWDVRFTPAGIARSHSMDEFPMHTDCSYEEPAPRFIALLVLHADRGGHGVNRLVPVARLLQALPSALVKALRRPCYRIKVPPEFYRGVEAITVPVLLPGGPDLIRFRADIVSVDREAAGEHADLCQSAYEALSGLLQRDDLISSLWLPDDHLLLLDNARFLHGRMPFSDPQRHLQRMRFNMNVVG